MTEELTEISQADRDAPALGPQLCLGLYSGYGGVLWALAAMAAVHVPLSQETAARVLSLLMEYRDHWHGDPTLAEGLAGLMPGLDALPASVPERDSCARLCAEKLLAAGYAAERLPESEAANALGEMALLSLLDEKNLGRFDTLDQGNALTVLCLLRAGRIERAGLVLEAMRRRAEREGSYTVTSPGIRSFFDPCLWLGSLGVGYAAAAYLGALGQKGGGRT